MYQTVWGFGHATKEAYIFLLKMQHVCSGVGTGLHWMRAANSPYAMSGPDAAMLNITKKFHRLVPHLSRLAESTPTIFKLLDDVQVREVLDIFLW